MKLADILRAVVGVATGGATEAAGATARLLSLGAAIAAIAGPLAVVWTHRAELAQVWSAELVSFTVGQFVVGSSVLGLFIYLVTLLAHRAPSP